jgi:hypothetical protein
MLSLSLVVPCGTTLPCTPHWSNVLADATSSREEGHQQSSKRRQLTPIKDAHPARINKKFCFRRDSISLTSLLHTLLTFCDLYRCPRVAKKLHNLFVIKDINFFFIPDDSYASTAYSEYIAVYTYTECPNIIKTLKLCFFKWKLPSLILFLNSMVNYESNLYRSFLLICHCF